MTTPDLGSRWQHHNGIEYEVILIANEPGNESYPETVVYRGPNGKVWARPVSDWSRSFSVVGSKSE